MRAQVHQFGKKLYKLAHTLQMALIVLRMWELCNSRRIIQSVKNHGMHSLAMSSLDCSTDSSRFLDWTLYTIHTELAEICNCSYAVVPAELSSTPLPLVGSATTSFPFTSTTSDGAVYNIGKTLLYLFTGATPTSEGDESLFMDVLHADTAT